MLPSAFRLSISLNNLLFRSDVDVLLFTEQSEEPDPSKREIGYLNPRARVVFERLKSVLYMDYRLDGETGTILLELHSDSQEIYSDWTGRLMASKTEFKVTPLSYISRATSQERLL